jgi:hypothetical protein
MTLMRGLMTGAVALALAACNPSGNSDTPSDAAVTPALVAWSQIPEESIRVPEGANYSMVEAGGAAAAEISGVSADADSRGRTTGVSFRLPDAFETQASGANVRVTVRALSPTAGDRLGVAYSTAEVGNSGWRNFELTQTAADYFFDYQVPPLAEGNGDYLGFRSYGDGVVQILGYRTEIISSEPAAAGSGDLRPR